MEDIMDYSMLVGRFRSQCKVSADKKYFLEVAVEIEVLVFGKAQG